MFPWSNTQEPQPYAVGDKVRHSEGHAGTITHVSTVVARLVSVVWDNGKDEIIYPMDADYLRKAMPWE